MIDSPTSRNLADFKQRYQGVLGWLHKEKGKKIAVFVSNVNSGKVTFTDAAGAQYYANVDADVQFEFLPTQRAWYNVGKDTYLLQRVPARQWKRGICADNTSFLHLLGDILYPLEESWQAGAFKVMTNALPPQEQVPMYLLGQRESVALSKHFALSPNEVYFINLPIGKIDKSKGTITLRSKYVMIAQELSDVINRNNYPFKVIQ